MQLIELKAQHIALVDDDAPSWIFSVKWSPQYTPSGRVYAVRHVWEGSVRKMQKMHAVIAGTPPGKQTRHLNGNGLDNRRENLVPGTAKENQQDPCKRRCDNTSGWRGVSFNKRIGYYQASLQHEGQRIHAGYHGTAEEAARARDAKARELGWPEAGMNFPLDFFKQQPIVAV